MNTKSSIKYPAFVKNENPYNQFLIPSLPFSIWDGDTLMWASDERYAKKLTCAQRENMAKDVLIMNGKSYTIVCPERHETLAYHLTSMIQASVSGKKDRNEMPLLSIYHLCKDFFTRELSTHFHYSNTNLTPWAMIECGIPFMFALLLTVHPILCKDPSADIDIHFEEERELSTITITPHCEIDLNKDILYNDFISDILRATLENSEFSMEEIQDGDKKKITLSSKHVSKYSSIVTLNANDSETIHCVFALFLSLSAKYQDSI